MCQNKRFIESIRIENRLPSLLEFHQERVTKTFSHFGKEKAVFYLKNILQSMEISTDEVYKLRILYDLEGNWDTELVPYSISETKSFQLMENPSIDYSYKYENRDIFLEMKQKSTADEIILTKNGNITDTSFSNLIFLKNGQWHTPKTYLLNGVQRRFLLKNNLIKETEIHTENLREFTHFKLINAMRGLSEENPSFPIALICFP